MIPSNWNRLCTSTPPRPATHRDEQRERYEDLVESVGDRQFERDEDEFLDLYLRVDREAWGD